MPVIKSLSLILSSAHHPALFLTQYGIALSSSFSRKPGLFVGFSNRFNEYFSLFFPGNKDNFGLLRYLGLFLRLF